MKLIITFIKFGSKYFLSKLLHFSNQYHRYYYHIIIEWEFLYFLSGFQPEILSLLEMLFSH